MGSKAILFTKENCPPCLKTKEFINVALNETLVAEHLVIMKKENHSALVAAYELEKYPTLLIVNKEGEETVRVMGGERIRHHLQYILEGIHQANS